MQNLPTIPIACLSSPHFVSRQSPCQQLLELALQAGGVNRGWSDPRAGCPSEWLLPMTLFLLASDVLLAALCHVLGKHPMVPRPMAGGAAPSLSVS